MEQSTQKRALGLKDKIPDIQKTLETVQFLKSRDVRLTLIFLPGNLPKLTFFQPAGRRRTPRDFLRVERHPVRQSKHRESRRGLPLARSMFPQQQPFHSLTRLTSRHRRDPNSNQKKEETIANVQPSLSLPSGQRHALLPNPRS